MSSGDLDCYIPHPPIRAGEGFDHKADGPVVALYIAVLQQYEVPLSQIWSLKMPFPAALKSTRDTGSSKMPEDIGEMLHLSPLAFVHVTFIKVTRSMEGTTFWVRSVAGVR